MSVEIANESGVDINLDVLEQQARFMLGQLRIHPEAELSVVLLDEVAMTELHVKHMHEPGPTDVLSFPMDELRPTRAQEIPEPGMLGDVVICPQVAQQQAQAAGHPTDAEIALLLTHGLLHLLGFDHGEPEEHEQMFDLQARLLAQWADSSGAG